MENKVLFASESALAYSSTEDNIMVFSYVDDQIWAGKDLSKIDAKIKALQDDGYLSQLNQIATCLVSLH
jgi:hypothetical protein